MLPLAHVWAERVVYEVPEAPDVAVLLGKVVAGVPVLGHPEDVGVAPDARAVDAAVREAALGAAHELAIQADLVGAPLLRRVGAKCR